MADISKEVAVQLAREAGFEIVTPQGLKIPKPEVFAANVLVTSEIERICQAAFKLGRNAGLDEAKQVAKETCSHDATLFGDGFNTAALVIERAIKSLKDNTP